MASAWVRGSLAFCLAFALQFPFLAFPTIFFFFFACCGCGSRWPFVLAVKRHKCQSPQERPDVRGLTFAPAPGETSCSCVVFVDSRFLCARSYPPLETGDQRPKLHPLQVLLDQDAGGVHRLDRARGGRGAGVHGHVGQAAPSWLNPVPAPVAQPTSYHIECVLGIGGYCYEAPTGPGLE